MEVYPESPFPFAEGARRLESKSISLICAADSAQAVEVGWPVLPINVGGAVYFTERCLQHA